MLCGLRAEGGVGTGRNHRYGAEHRRARAAPR
jgi:hypothetical protein